MAKTDRPPPTPAAFDDVEPAGLSLTPGLTASLEAAQSSYEQWRAERAAKGRDLMLSARRHWAAMQGWDRLETQADWERLREQTVEDWESGVGLLQMLGGERFVEPERAALCLMLWDDFRTKYQPQGPAEYMLVAMAVLSFDHFLRVNGLVHGIQARLESEFFGLESLTTDRSPHRMDRSVRGLTAEQIVDQLGMNLLPLLDRLNRLVIRNLRVLRELKSTPLAVTVANYGQVNVGQTQTNQVASAPRPSRRRSAAEQIPVQARPSGVAKSG